MDELITILQRINDNLTGIRTALLLIGLYLSLMLFLKDMGNGARNAIDSLKDKISERRLSKDE
jgi:hypothetical protein